MENPPKVLAVIVARGGSKRVPGKNMLPIGNSPMIFYSILAAQDSRYISKIAVSTDCDQIGDYCSALGVDYIKRPDEISGDEADISSAVKHAVDQYVGIDYVVTLQAAVPFRPRGMIDALLDEMLATLSGSGLSMVRAAPWSWTRSAGRLVPGFDSDNYPRSQDLPAAFQEINAVQITTLDVVKNGERWRSPLSVVVMPDIFAADIDTFEDYQEARDRWSLIKNYYFEARKYVTFTDKVSKK